MLKQVQHDTRINEQLSIFKQILNQFRNRYKKELEMTKEAEEQ